jgi:hypothetical protein
MRYLRKGTYGSGKRNREMGKEMIVLYCNKGLISVSGRHTKQTGGKGIVIRSKSLNFARNNIKNSPKR